MVQATIKHLRSAASPRDTFQPEVQAGAVLRSVLGHLLAAKLDSDDVSTDKLIRDYLNGHALSNTLKVYYWLYPYRVTVVARDFSFQDVSNWIVVDGASVLKFFPLAFMVTNASVELPLQPLHGFAWMKATESTTLDMNLEFTMPQFWPERPNRMHVVTGGAAFSDAICSIDGHFPKKLSIQSH